jgi:hypothetical protein
MSRARLTPAADGVFVVDHAVPLAFGAQLPVRMTILQLDDRALWLHSPVPIDDELAAEIERVGPVRDLVAPNAFHHLYLSAAARRYPVARVTISSALRRKRPDLSTAGTLDDPPPDWSRSMETLTIEGVPKIGESVFWHQTSGSLIVTDLVFNVREPMALATRLMLKVTGTHDRFAQSRIWSLMANDLEGARASFDRIVAKPIQRIILAHGQIVDGPNAKQALVAAATRFGRK